MAPPLTDRQFATLLEFRVAWRRFTHWSEQQVLAAGVTPAQHQLLTAIRGHADRRGPTITEVSEYLLLRHHSVIGIVQRAEALGLVQRRSDPDDHRLVRLRLTAVGRRRVDKLAALHLAELVTLAPLLEAAVTP